VRDDGEVADEARVHEILELYQLDSGVRIRDSVPSRRDEKGQAAAFAGAWPN
jgi:hypothetical protein